MAWHAAFWPHPDYKTLACLMLTACRQVLGLPVIRVAGVEADDVIGTVATRAVADGFLVAVASPDKACTRCSSKIRAH